MFAAERIAYHQTGAFSKIVTDYLNGEAALLPFYSQPPTLDGIRSKLKERAAFATDRELLVEVLKAQYSTVPVPAAVHANLEFLLAPNTYTVCTAHQPNLFTGLLYFMYKIIHAVKLAAEINTATPEIHVVPVYYMGSEDADFAELAHTYVDGKRLEWKREQSGAVGRMVVDKTLVQLIDELEGQLSVEPHGKEVIALLRTAYAPGKTVQQATFELLNDLYGEQGLVILIPDNPALKQKAKTVFHDDLFRHTPQAIVQQTSELLSTEYKAQAYPRPINLFYLKEAVRERIEEVNGHYQVLNINLSFTADELQRELDNHPERFSPNVVLRGLYQELLLPNLAFVGGGGELAYWLQLKDLFSYYGVPYPVLVLRNSFLVVEQKWQRRMDNLRLPTATYFRSTDGILSDYVQHHSSNELSLEKERLLAHKLYQSLSSKAGAVDGSLLKHVAAVNSRIAKAMTGVEKKLLRAEKRKFAEQQGQIASLRAALFPNDGLQERVENFSRFYAKWGKTFIDDLYAASSALGQEFTVLKEQA